MKYSGRQHFIEIVAAERLQKLMSSLSCQLAKTEPETEKRKKAEDEAKYIRSLYC